MCNVAQVRHGGELGRNVEQQLAGLGAVIAYISQAVLEGDLSNYFLALVPDSLFDSARDLAADLMDWLAA